MVIYVTSMTSVAGIGNQIFPFKNFYFCDKIMIMESTIINWIKIMLVGASGGLASYFYCLRRNLFKNNHLVKKFFCDLFGGALVAPFIAFVFSDTLRIIVAFGVGLCWARIIEVIRVVITKKVEERLKKLG